PTEP
ncbi:putative exonuclease VIII, ds DNA exonuclease encoded by prophage, partial [Escherichia coli 89.0511]